MSSQNIIPKMLPNNLIQSYLTAIDNRNKKEIELLYNNDKNNNIENDIVYEMYKEDELSSERLQFIIENCTAYLDISSSLIKLLIKDNNKQLLKALFKNLLKFFDNNFILKLLKYSESKTSVSDSELYPLINNDTYKISTEWNEDFVEYNSSYYLFNACKSGNEAAVKFLIEHGADMTIKDRYNRIALAEACESGNYHLVKYLVHLGADIYNMNRYCETHIFNACTSGNLNSVKYLVEHGLDINIESTYGITPLFVACEKGYPDIVKYLVEQGAIIDKESDYYNSAIPLFNACSSGNLDLVKHLV